MMSVFESGIMRVAAVCLNANITTPQHMRQAFANLLTDTFSVYDFFANYVALSSVLVNLLPNPPWSSQLSIMKESSYPIDSAARLDKELLRARRVGLIQETLRLACPKHPWFTSENKRHTAANYIDTINIIVDMFNLAGSEQLYGTMHALIARENGVYAGHIFITVANETRDGVRAAWPFGITRSLLHLPGACIPAKSGFVDSLMQRVFDISAENGVTHIFSWPRDTMSKRFASYGFTLFNFHNVSEDLRDTAQKAMSSVLIKTHVDRTIKNDLRHFLFVMKDLQK